MRAPAYKLLTDTEVEVEQEAYARWANQHLHMPPVMNPRQEIDQIFAKDPDIADALPSNFVFVDISMNVKDRVSKNCVRATSQENLFSEMCDKTDTKRSAHMQKLESWKQKIISAR